MVISDGNSFEISKVSFGKKHSMEEELLLEGVVVLNDNGEKIYSSGDMFKLSD
jgi:hypothetical protein